MSPTGSCVCAFLSAGTANRSPRASIDHARTVVGHIQTLHVVARIDHAVPDLPAVGWRGHRDLRVAAVGAVKHMQVAVLHVHDPRAVGVRHHDVERVVVRHRRDGLRGQVLHVQVRDAVAVGHEEHALAHPHRVGVLADVVRDRRERARREVVHPDVAVLAALVALPLVFLAPLRQ